MLTLLTATFGSLSLEAGGEGHINKLKFKGILLQLDTPSDKAPNGSKGHRILIPKSVAQARVKTLIGMGVNLSSELDRHAPQRKVGVIKKAWIEGSALWISGYIWKKDFPDAEKALDSEKLGMSFEGSQVDIEDQHAHIWRVKDLIFTGAALLLKQTAAYTKTEALAASAMSAELVGIESGGFVMADKNKKIGEGVDQEQLIGLISAALEKAVSPMVTAVQAQTAAITTMHASMESNQADLTDLVEVLASKKSEGKSDDDEDDDEDDEEAAGEKVTAAKKKKKSDDDDDDDSEDEDDEDDEDDDDDEEGSGEKVTAAKVEACKECGGKGCKSCGKMKAEEGLEDLGEDVPDDMEPGKMAKDAEKQKGKKTSVTASATKQSPLRKLVNKLMAENEKMAGELKAARAETKKFQVQASKAAEAVARKSKAVVKLSASAANASKPSALFTGLVDKYDLAAGTDGAKKTMAEYNEVLNGAGITDAAQRVALKIEAERAGIVYTTAELAEMK